MKTSFIRDRRSRQARPTAYAILAIALVFCSPVRAQEFDRELMKRASVAFIGTVVRQNAVTFPAVPRSAETAVVRIDHVLEKPSAIALRSGDSVTLRLNDPSLLPENSPATFYADGWIVGTGVALVEVGHTPVSAPDAAQREQAGRNFLTLKRQLVEEDLRARIDGASLVALGKVVAVQPAVQDRRFITEHDPDWKEAVVRVETAIKGANVGDDIVIRFPGSMDVAYYRIPKLTVGDEPLVLAAKDTVSGLPPAMLAGKPTEAFIIQSPGDVLTKDDLERVQQAARRK